MIKISSYAIPVSVFAFSAILAVAGCGTSGDGGGQAPVAPASSTITAHAYSLHDNSDLNTLMASATHVFTGQVLEVTGAKELSANPETQFSVSTGVVVKGELAKTVTVNQSGGVKDGVYISVDGDKPLRVGQWYRFAARHLPSEDWYTVIAVYGDVPITEAEALSESSEPVAEAVAALEANPQGRLDQSPQVPQSPPLTFPVPKPGDDNPVPSSPPPASSPR